MNEKKKGRCIAEPEQAERYCIRNEAEGIPCEKCVMWDPDGTMEISDEELDSIPF